MNHTHKKAPATPQVNFDAEPSACLAGKEVVRSGSNIPELEA